METGGIMDFWISSLSKRKRARAHDNNLYSTANADGIIEARKKPRLFRSPQADVIRAVRFEQLLDGTDKWTDDPHIVTAAETMGWEIVS